MPTIQHPQQSLQQLVQLHHHEADIHLSQEGFVSPSDEEDLGGLGLGRREHGDVDCERNLRKGRHEPALPGRVLVRLEALPKTL